MTLRQKESSNPIPLFAGTFLLFALVLLAYLPVFRAGFIWEAVNTLSASGQAAARAYCRRAASQLESEYDRRHAPLSDNATRNDVTATRVNEDPVSDDETAALNDRHKWSA